MKHEIFWAQNENKRIYGEVFFPEGSGPFRLLIYSHGFGYNIQMFDLKILPTKGIAACFFDFCGGSLWSKSDGRSTDMSVMTELKDLECVLDHFKKDDRIDSDQIWLCGNSQGGYVSIMAGIERQREIQGIFPICPAFIIANFKMNFISSRLIPETFYLNGMQLGRCYASDVEKFPIWDRMREFTKPVWLYHGTADEMVPFSYSVKAQKIFPNAHLMELPRAGHMIEGYGKAVAEDIAKHILNKDTVA